MKKLFAENLLGSDGWMSNVTMAIRDDGTIDSLTPDTSAGNSERFKIAIPGIVNAHSHAFQRLMAGLAEFRHTGHDTFWTWRDIMYKAALALTPEDQKTISAYLHLELLRHGYTSLVEFHYLHHQPCGRPYEEIAAMSLATIAAAGETGIGLTLLPTLYMAADFSAAELSPNQARFGTNPDTIGRILDASNRALGENKNCTTGLAAHSLRAVPLPVLGELLELRQTLKIKPFHIHIAEHSREVEDCIATHDRRPVELLLDSVPVDRDWTLVHATHLDQDEIERLASSGATVAICPTTEANLGDGIFPLPQFLEHEGHIAMGSDSHVCISPWEELRWLEYVQRLITRSRNVITAEQRPHCGTNLLALLAKTAGRTTGRSTGRLQAGERADLVVLDENAVQFSGRCREQILDTAIFACDANPVRHVMVGGWWRIRDGRHAQEDFITRDYRRVVHRLSKDM